MNTVISQVNVQADASARSFFSTIPGRMVACIAATMIVAAAAHVAIPLPFTPVPLTLQPLAVLGVGLALGPLDGFLAMLAYLAEGASGMPVFSPTGAGGVLQLVGPTGGFLMAYPVIAALSGGITRRLDKGFRPFLAAAVGCTIAICVLFACGASWLMHVHHLGLHATWIAAVAPFLPGETVKVAIAAGTYSALRSRNTAR